MRADLVVIKCGNCVLQFHKNVAIRLLFKLIIHPRYNPEINRGIVIVVETLLPV